MMFKTARMNILKNQHMKQVHKISWCQYQWCKSQLCQLHSASTHLSKEEYRLNSIDIQMLSENLHKQIFKKAHTKKLTTFNKNKVGEHLRAHGLSTDKTHMLKEVEIKLPEIHGNNIDEHFRHIAEEQAKPYVELMEDLAALSLPPIPTEWSFTRGWTKYNSDGSSESVPFPQCQGLVFDIETLVPEGPFPTMATAASTKHWYSWVSDYVLEDKFRWSQVPQLSDLIPLETQDGSVTPPGGNWLPRLVIGHNVGFDRSFVKEQYPIKGSKMKFWDTMSMHITVCGQTSFQRLISMACGTSSKRKEIAEHQERQKKYTKDVNEDWMKMTSMNNLRDVHKLHCKSSVLEKTLRSVFVEGTMGEIRDQFQELMSYCAADVKATHEVYVALWPEFEHRFPHPVTRAGMLEMGTAYLPLNDSWTRYIQNSNNCFEENQKELKKMLMTLADEACRLHQNDAYKKDPWLWDLDWSKQAFKMNVPTVMTKKTKEKLKEFEERGEKELGQLEVLGLEDPIKALDEIDKFPLYLDALEFMEGPEAASEYRRTVREVYATGAMVPAKPKFMAGFPEWYRELCHKPKDVDFYPGPSRITTATRVTPKLMRLTWEGFPVHHNKDNGWGYLVPCSEEINKLESEHRRQDLGLLKKEDSECQFPLREYLAFMRSSKPDVYGDLPEDPLGLTNASDPFRLLDPTDFDSKAMEVDEKQSAWAKAMGRKRKAPTKKLPIHKPPPGIKPIDIDIPGIRFYKIPHKDGREKSKVGSPLAKDYLSRTEDGTLKAIAGKVANRALVLSKVCSYWRNNRKRIMGQMFVWLQNQEQDKLINSHPDYNPEGQYGAIVPRVVTAGTITRRAMEATWLTASNAYTDRIGSELKAMVQAPPGYNFVGADVDSQELWIASLLGDAHYMGEHGCTALGWMTLQGEKAKRTDLHSMTARKTNITRDDAKVLNYGRLYGAGPKFAESLLKQFDPQLTPLTAKNKVMNLYKQTKGQRNSKGGWEGGSESSMYNACEKMAKSKCPRSPVLSGHISKALEPQYVGDDFMTSRVNWVVQSSGVDYLHLLLVAMRWMIDAYAIQGRFSISIHDEVRYLMAEEDKYRGALALQVANLLTRAEFAHQMGMTDLPQSVAFFSEVDVDKCLRKEVKLDCITPSNPQGIERGFNVPPGEALDIHKIIEKTQGRLEKQKCTNHESQKLD